MDRAVGAASAFDGDGVCDDDERTVGVDHVDRWYGADQHEVSARLPRVLSTREAAGVTSSFTM